MKTSSQLKLVQCHVAASRPSAAILGFQATECGAPPGRRYGILTPTLLKLLLLATATACCGLSAPAQISFRLADLPTDIGDYYRAYANGLEVPGTGMAAPGGPRRWDTSDPRFEDETIRRTDVVPATDGGHGASFPQATYAERFTNEANGTRSWQYLPSDSKRGPHLLWVVQ